MFAEEDKKKREEVDTKNNAENYVFQCEKALKDFGDKVTSEEKAPIEAKCEALKEALKGSDTADIKAKTEELQKRSVNLPQKFIRMQVLKNRRLPSRRQALRQKTIQATTE